jgi:hypothetical protein
MVAGMGRRRLAGCIAICVIVAAVAAATVSAHVERASYWPDPAPDNSVGPPAGGEVPQARSLYSALDDAPPGETHVVCKDGTESTDRLESSIAQAQSEGYELRPSADPLTLSEAEATQLRDFNQQLLASCDYESIQDAVFAAGNSDRVVIMPGVYTEPESRAQPTHDPACDHLRQQNDEGSAEALSYAYQYECPNDQNLIAVMGREPGPGEDPQPPLWDRHGIPNLGPCVRCNVQIEGSGVGPDDVVIDAGDASAGNGGPSGAGSAKDVAIRADRADGFVLRNVTTRHAAEHNVYILESDGYRAERFKTYYPGEYGVLTFVEDHGLIQDCEAKGAGDAGLYPGAAADTGEQTVEAARRYNQEVRSCDSHHNAAGYSATTGNAVHVHHNDFYDNALGLTTDVFTASGHPGFPSDSLLIEHNDFYSNNFNPYLEGSDVEPTVPFPVGTGMWIAGGNNITVRNNRFWDNWRRGTMVFGVPDALVCGPAADGNEQAGCDPTQVSTSHRNRHHGNVMGRDPAGQRDPNGLDFWWDQFPGNRNNCWYDNTGKLGTAGSVTSSPPGLLLPRNCATSIGTGNPVNEAELLACFAGMAGEEQGVELPVCDWFTTPAEPQ